MLNTLLIDDEPLILRLISRQLARLGLDDVSTYERATEALDVLEAGGTEVGLIFCDLQMPGMDGIEFIRNLARIGFGGGLVMMSGEDTRILGAAEMLARAHKLEVLGSLHKPFSLDQLKSILERKTGRIPPGSRGAPRVYTPEEMRQGIARGELVNFYQPKVELATGAVSGVESLVRWRHPRDGLVFPDQFITVAEENGLIDELLSSVMSDALAQAKLWWNAGLQLQVAVNVSMDNLVSLEFPDLFSRLVDESGIPASSLTLEVTESRLMKDPVASLDILTRLRLKRARLSIDDFGTGHSSLAQLRDIPFDELKVDRNFVHGACRDPSLSAIFEGSHSMARQMGMKTVAEGVEDREDWDFLRNEGCDQVQGYFIAKPMPGGDLMKWIGAWDERRPGLCR